MQYKQTIGPDDPAKACDALAHHTGLSKTCIKQAMIKGAVWLKRPRAALQRLRRATTRVQPGDTLMMYYSQEILDLVPPQARCIRDMRHYSIWFKPAGLLTQGTRYGDHCALMRQVEHHFDMKRKVFLIHRIDREAAGLVVVAHDKKAAGHLSQLFLKRLVEKKYLIRVRGNLNDYAPSGRIAAPLDGKSAITAFDLIRYEPERDCSVVQVCIETGRYHQIRRHFDGIGFPVMGDPVYGRGNKDRSGLQLVAYHLAFDCPFGNGMIQTVIDPEDLICL